MSAWMPARPSIEKDLKTLGFSDADIKKLADTKGDRKKLKDEVAKMMVKYKAKQAAVKGLFKDLNF
jgi:formylmethanofuran dehydrogenase subunit D